MTKEESKLKITKLIEKFHTLDAHKVKGINEAATKQGFIQPLFEALGWDFTDYLEYKPMYTSPLAIPEQSTDEGISGLVNKILSAKDPQADVSKLEHQLDVLVYQLYGLTPEEIALIEGN